MKKNKISAIKDKDLMADTGGITKTREHGEHQRPPRVNERDNFRDRYLDKEEKKDLTADIDLSVDDSGQVYVNDNDNKHEVHKMSDLVSIPEYVNQSYDVMLENSMNSDNNYYEVPVDEENTDDFANFDSFTFADDNVEDEVEEASDEDIEIAEDEDSNPFDGMFDTDDNSDDTENPMSDDPEIDETSDDTLEDDETTDEELTDSDEESTNDGIDNYLNMEIDDSKLSEENKEKLDNFTPEQLDAFKKFLYENKVKKEEEK